MTYRRPRAGGWLLPTVADDRSAGTQYLNDGVKTFLRSKEAHRMAFALEYCNHAPYQVKAQADWRECIKTWVAAMKHLRAVSRRGIQRKAVG
jgi:hypothetical protein